MQKKLQSLTNAGLHIFMSLIMRCVALKCANVFFLNIPLRLTQHMYVCVLTLHTQGHVEFTRVTRLSLPLSHAAEQKAASGIHYCVPFIRVHYRVQVCTCTFVCT